MKKNLSSARPVLPIYLFGLAWVAYAVFFPLFRYYDYIFALLAALAAAFICQLIITKGESRAVAYNPALDQDGAKKIVFEAKSCLAAIETLCRSISDGYIERQAGRIIEISRLTLAEIGRDGSLLSRDRRFIIFYLPLALRLFEAYQGLAAASGSSANMLRRSRLEGMIDSVVRDFERQADILKGELTADFSSNIAVLESQLARGGFGMEEKS